MAIPEVPHPHVDASAIEPGVIFATPFESGCVVVTAPYDEYGTFDGLDSDGVLCSFVVAMVICAEARVSCAA